jgi:hypothetical protein
MSAAVVATALNVALYLAALAAGVPLEITEVFEDEFKRMAVLNFIIATLLEGGALATVVAMACRRWTGRPRAWFVVLATFGTVVSFVLPVVSDGTTATKVVLCITHVVAAVVIVPVLALALPPR